VQLHQVWRKVHEERARERGERPAAGSGREWSSGQAETRLVEDNGRRHRCVSFRLRVV